MKEDTYMEDVSSVATQQAEVLPIPPPSLNEDYLEYKREPKYSSLVPLNDVVDQQYHYEQQIIPI